MTKTRKKIEISRQVRSLVKPIYKLFALEAEDLAIYLGAHVIWPMITCGPIAVNNVNSRLKPLGLSEEPYSSNSPTTTISRLKGRHILQLWSRQYRILYNCTKAPPSSPRRVVNGPRIMTLPRRYRSPRQVRRFLGQYSGMGSGQKSSLDPWREGRETISRIRIDYLLMHILLPPFPWWGSQKHLRNNCFFNPALTNYAWTNPSFAKNHLGHPASIPASVL